MTRSCWWSQVTGGPGGELQIFDLTVLKQVAAVPGHAAQVNCMVAGPEASNIFFSGSADRCVMLFFISRPTDGCLCEQLRLMVHWMRCATQDNTRVDMGFLTLSRSSAATHRIIVFARVKAHEPMSPRAMEGGVVQQTDKPVHLPAQC